MTEVIEAGSKSPAGSLVSEADSTGKGGPSPTAKIKKSGHKSDSVKDRHRGSHHDRPNDHNSRDQHTQDGSTSCSNSKTVMPSRSCSRSHRWSHSRSCRRSCSCRHSHSWSRRHTHTHDLGIVVVVTGHCLTTDHEDTPIQGQGQKLPDVTGHHLHATIPATLLPYTPAYSPKDVNLDLDFYLILIQELG